MPSRGSHCQIESWLPADAPQTELRRLAGSALLVLKDRVTSVRLPGMTSIDIRLGQTYVGEWSFDQSPQQLVAARTADGFRMTLPSSVMLRLDPSYQPWPAVTGLRVRVQAHTQPPLDLGIAMDGAWYTGGMPDSTVNVQLEWRSTIEALQQYERIRNGGSAQFVFQCIGEVCHIGGGKNGSWPRYRSEPEAIRGDIYITYPKETWVAMLNQLGARNNVLVSFPFARVPQRRGTAFGRHCKTRGTTSTRVAQLDGRDAYGRSGMRSNSGGTSRLSSTALGGRRRGA